MVIKRHYGISHVSISVIENDTPLIDYMVELMVSKWVLARDSRMIS